MDLKVKLFFFLLSSDYLEVEKYLFSLRVTNSMSQLLLFHFRVKNVKFLNERNSINITVRIFVNP